MNLDISTLSENLGSVGKTVWPKNSVGYVLVGRENGQDITGKHRSGDKTVSPYSV